MKVILMAIIIASSSAWGSFDESYTSDNKLRAVFKNISFESIGIEATEHTQDLALAVILSVAKSYKLNINLEELEFERTNSSLLGIHYRFKQVRAGTEVRGAIVSVSLDHSLKNVVKFYTTYRETNDLPIEEKIREDQAVEIAWNQSKFSGELREFPAATLVYKNINGKEKLVYEVLFTVGEPVGSWIVSVDAVNGKIIQEIDENIYRRTYNPSTTKQKMNLEENLKNLAFKEAKTLFTPPFLDIRKDDGRGIIFDPNPVTTLRNSDLKDGSRASEFNAAYLNVDLKGITVKDGTYYLENDDIKLIDFDQPTSAPSTTQDGNWDNVRKDIKFNDVMTFYHLDLSMKYLKSIGYDDKKNIFPKGLKADSNGVGGADNSYYQPSGKRLAFGHGCVDDNEDTDVILHELGHAIEDHIVGGFNGGDTGAIGEGFGDYWAASYSYTTKNGDFEPNWVFKWDGHNDCWGGRKLNALEAKYVHSRTYAAHARLGEDVTDELWSTPVFQSFRSLMDDKIATYDEIQKIIIEAHFGLGYGIKMRDMAISIINTTKNLFPDRGIENYYIENFKRHNIIE